MSKVIASVAEKRALIEIEQKKTHNAIVKKRQRFLARQKQWDE